MEGSRNGLPTPNLGGSVFGGFGALGLGALGLWGFGALGLWGFGALGLWGFGAWGFRLTHPVTCDSRGKQNASAGREPTWLLDGRVETRIPKCLGFFTRKEQYKNNSQVANIASAMQAFGHQGRLEQGLMPKPVLVKPL